MFLMQVHHRSKLSSRKWNLERKSCCLPYKQWRPPYKLISRCCWTAVFRLWSNSKGSNSKYGYNTNSMTLGAQVRHIRVLLFVLALSLLYCQPSQSIYQEASFRIREEIPELTNHGSKIGIFAESGDKEEPLSKKISSIGALSMSVDCDLL